MKIELETKLKYTVSFSSDFKKQYKKIKKQGKDINKLKEIIKHLANLEDLEPKYRNHMLNDNKYYKNCGECHIEPDWLLVYKYIDEQLILLLIATGSHSELF